MGKGRELQLVGEWEGAPASGSGGGEGRGGRELQLVGVGEGGRELQLVSGVGREGGSSS